MNLPATLDSCETVAFEFEGRGATHRFEFFVIDEVPWIRVEDAEARLYEEDGKYDRTLTRQSPFRPQSATLNETSYLQRRAELHVDKRYYARHPRHGFLLMCSALVQVLTTIDSSISPSAKAFREQLGDWMQRGMMDGRKKLQAVAQSGAVAGDALAHLRAVVAALEQQQQQISTVDAKSTTAVKIAQSTQQAVEKMREQMEQGFMLCDQWLAVNGDGRMTSVEFSRFMVDCLRKSGGFKDESGWFTRDGIRVSHVVPGSGTRFSKLNKWDVQFMAASLRVAA